MFSLLRVARIPYTKVTFAPPCQVKFFTHTITIPGSSVDILQIEVSNVEDEANTISRTDQATRNDDKTHITEKSYMLPRVCLMA